MRSGFVRSAILLMFIAGMTFAQTPKPEEVAQMVENISLPQDQLKSLAFDMRMNLPMPLSILCQLRYQAPDQYALHVFDNYDQTPILIIIGHTAMINDPFASNLTLVASAGVAFNFVPQGSDYNAQFAFNMPLDGKINNHVELDFKTMFSRVSENLKVENATAGSLVFSGNTEQKSRCTAILAAQEKFALREVRLFIENEPTAILEIEKIKVDAESEPIADMFPLAALASSSISLNFIEPQGMIDTALVAMTVIKAVFARSAIRDPQLREKIEAMLNQKVDWFSVESVDASRSEKLREIFKPL
ncbi:MAG: hypothetical protein KKB51_07545 [Candidatus Riflebacteria bacterium]|nr:hypothetical protein [Candidatus Riflebacteria bacterium]